MFVFSQRERPLVVVQRDYAKQNVTFKRHKRKMSLLSAIQTDTSTSLSNNR